MPSKTLTALAFATLLSAQQINRTPPQNAEFEALQAHFERTVGARAEKLFSGITTVPQWETRKSAARAELIWMLWGDLKLPATPPPAVTVHRHERAAYIIENIVIESMPKLFVTANLYLPKSGPGPFPVVLYQCGHANKNYFTRHGAWLAAHGIAVLIMDNIEMGEIEFTHHGVYSNAWFEWYSRGFSPLAVELLNARRAIDYLAARPGLDPKRIGATGRSGGGMTTFFLAAIDERIKASAPVSGTLSTTGWVNQRLSFAHCDCQYPVNSYGLLYAEIGALVAPRAHLQCNADADPGFPMNAFNELIGKMRTVYRLYNADAALTTAVTPGGHTDTEAIRLPVYNFFLKKLLGVPPVTAEGPVDEPPHDELVCYRQGIPIDEKLSRIDEELLPPRGPSRLAPPQRKKELVNLLRTEVFRYFPAQPAPLNPQWSAPVTRQDRTTQSVTYTGLDGLRVKAIYSRPASAPAEARLPALLLADHRRGIPVWGNEQPLERNQWGNRAVLIVETLDTGSRALERNLRSFADNDPLHHMKREAMVAGTTLESIRVYELLRSLELLRGLPGIDPARIAVAGKGENGVNAMYAAFLDGGVQRVVLHAPPASHLQGPHYLGVLRYTDIAEVAALSAARVAGGTPSAPQAAIRSAVPCRNVMECLQ